MPRPIYIREGLTRIGLVPLGSVPPGGRRRIETAAVMRLIAEMFGPGATLTHDPHGAPLLNGAEAYISVSHSRGWAVLAANLVDRIGVDIEEWRSQLERVAGRFLSPSDDAEWHRRLLEAWTAKEAVYKASGNHALTSSDIVLRRPCEALATTADGRAFSLQWLRPAFVGENHVIALAAQA